MTGTRPAQAGPEVRRILRAAIAVPGKYAEKHCLDDETEHQASAVAAALDAAGYRIVPAGPERGGEAKP